MPPDYLQYLNIAVGLFAYYSDGTELRCFLFHFLALTVRFLTRRFIGEYDQTLGR